MSDNEDHSDSYASSLSHQQIQELEQSTDQLLHKAKLTKQKDDDSLNHSRHSDHEDYELQEQKNRVKIGTCIFTDNFEIVTLKTIKEQAIQLRANQEKLTCSVLTKFEKARILGVRARQIRQHTALYIDLTPKERNTLTPIQIAERQLYAKKIPFKIRRYLPDDGYEEWELKDFDL